MNGSVQRYINNPSHHQSQNDMLVLDPSSGQLTLEEDVWTTQAVNTLHWTTGYAGFISCSEPFYFENGATEFRAFGADGVYNSIQQPWTATSYNGYRDSSLPWGSFYCNPAAGRSYVNYDEIEGQGVEMYFDLGPKGTLYAYVRGFLAYDTGINGGNTVSFSLPADFYLYNVPAYPVCPPTFAPSYSVASGNGLAGVATVDLNHDGFPDLITANYGDHDGSILLNNGNGTFGVANRFGTAAGTPQVVATGDFNHDNNADFVVGNGAGWVSVFQGDGLGGYIWLAHAATPGVSPRAIDVADLDGDTHLDLAIAGDGPTTTLLVMWGNGDGTFQPPLQYGSGSLNTSHTGIAVGNFNGDAIPDLAVTNGGDTVSVVLGLGARSFSSGVNYPTGSVPYAIVAGNFNSDSYTDLAVANSGSSTVSIMLGDGVGGFVVGATQPVGTAVVALTKGDLNADGKMDLVTGNYLANTMTVLMGLGSGTFYRPTSDLAIGTGVNAASAAIADLDADGKLDIVTTNASGNGVYTFKQLQSQGPAISQQPANFNACVGGSAQFSVFPRSSTSRTYRWRKNGTPLSNGPNVSGATTATLYLSNISLESDGAVYECVVTTACGSTASNPATLTVRTPIIFTEQPQSVTICRTESATLTVAVSNAAPLSYQWNKGGFPVVGATSPTLLLQNPISEAGSYTCVVSNACGSYSSNAATLSVTQCDCIDFNDDGLYPDTADFDDLLSVFSGGPCSNDPLCLDIDFNNDGLFPDTLDIDSFLSVFSGGPCLY